MALDITALEAAAESEIEVGLTACQLAVARDNEVIWARSFGSATDTTRFWIASATKPIVSSALFHLIAENKLDIAKPVAHYAPEFGANGKQNVTVEQVLLMTCGFPSAEDIGATQHAELPSSQPGRSNPNPVLSTPTTACRRTGFWLN